MSKISIIGILILIVGFYAILGFVLSEPQYKPTDDLDPTPQEPYAYESTYGKDGKRMVVDLETYIFDIIK